MSKPGYMTYRNYSYTDLIEMPSQKRREFFPKISGIKNAVIIGTQDQNGATNASLFHSLTHIGSNPPLLGLVFRPLTVERHTYENIKEGGYFSINWIPVSDIDAAHQCSAKYPKGISEFEATNRQPEFSEDIPVPYWPDAPVRVGLSYEEEHLIAANDTILLIGKVQELRIHDQLLDADGLPDFSDLPVALVNGLETYYTQKFIGRKPYARP